MMVGVSPPPDLGERHLAVRVDLYAGLGRRGGIVGELSVAAIVIDDHGACASSKTTRKALAAAHQVDRTHTIGLRRGR